MGKLVPFSWLVVTGEQVIAKYFGKGAEARARRRCEQERAAGVKAMVAEAWWSTGTTEQP